MELEESSCLNWVRGCAGWSKCDEAQAWAGRRAHPGVSRVLRVWRALEG